MDDLFWWGLNLATLGFSHVLLPLLDRFDIRAIFGFDTAAWERLGLPANIAARVVRGLQQLDMPRQDRLAAATGATLLGYRHPQFPVRLQTIDHPPLALAIRGRPELLARTEALAVVGARDATDYGREVAWHFSHQLARAGTVIVSGMALGIDARAHQGALDAAGDTIAFLGCGLDVCYPAELSGLRDRLAHSGALVSQYGFETRPLGHHFPYRNRLISGLSKGVLVVEGRMSSGSLHTVDWALQQGRDVYAIPGSIHSRQSILPHYLLQMGAMPVTCPQDLLMPVARIESAPSGAAPIVTAGEQEVLDRLGPTPVSIEQLSGTGGPGVSVLLATLLALELRGLVHRTPANRYWRDAPVARSPG